MTIRAVVVSLADLNDWSMIDFGRSNVDLPERIDAYQIHGRLGLGGMGVVLDATAEDGRRVALKLIRPTGDEEHSAMLKQRLLREAQILHTLDHPGIVGLVGYGEAKGLVYLAMEQVLGVTLADARKRTSFDAVTLASLGEQLSDALAHLHDAGVVHRDIKPGNVIIDAEGRAVLADFGIATRHQATGITKAGEVVGSVGYLSPEVFKGHPVTSYSDQYALGRLLFEMASVEPAKPIPSGVPIVVQFSLKMEVDWSRFPKGAEWSGLEPIVRRMLDETPGARFEDARAHGAAFRTYGEATKPPTQPTPPNPAKPDAPIANPTVFAEVNTLSKFVEQMGLEPRSPWAGSVADLDFEAVVRLDSDSADVDSQPIVHPVSESSLMREAVPMPVAPPPKRRWFGAFVAFVSSLVVGLAAGALLRPNTVKTLRTRATTPSLGYTYKGDAPPTDRAIAWAKKTLEEGRASLAARDLGEAERMFGACIEMADLPECHAEIALVLWLADHPEAAVHRDRASD